MSKSGALKVVNAVLAILILTQAGSGFFAIEIGHEAFEVIHKGGAAVLLVCIAVHIGLNWGWVKTAYRRRHS